MAKCLQELMNLFIAKIKIEIDQLFCRWSSNTSPNAGSSVHSLQEQSLIFQPAVPFLYNCQLKLWDKLRGDEEGCKAFHLSFQVEFVIVCTVAAS